MVKNLTLCFIITASQVICHQCCDVMLHCYMMNILWGKDKIITTVNHLRIGWTSTTSVRRRGSAHGLGGWVQRCVRVCSPPLLPQTSSGTHQQLFPQLVTDHRTNSSELIQTRLRDVKQSRLAPPRRHPRCPVKEKRRRFYVSDLSSFPSLLSLRQLHWVRETRVVLRR